MATTGISSGSRVRRAFTLIELLMVISIIVILASLLLPAIGVVRESANAATCLSNQRQFGMAFVAYLSDNKDIYPTGSWNNLLQPFINEGGRIGSITLEAVYRLARCPSTPKRTAAGWTLDLSYGYTGVYYSSIGPLTDPQAGPPQDGFSLNRHPFAWADFISASNPIVKNTKIYDAQILEPARKIVLSESWDSGGASVGQATWGVNTLNNRGMRRVHRNGSHILCADFHVQVLAVPATIKRYGLWATPTTKMDSMWGPRNQGSSILIRR